MQTGCKDIERVFDELAPRLETARVLDRELDRNLARKFNVLDYLRTDELGLSRIIADLLDPGARHGQGVLFLRAFLQNLEGSGKGPEWPDLDGVARISVVPEWHTVQGRKIDVVVTIEGPRRQALAFENKPYDKDRENQVRDYLGSLKEEYGDDFLLIYLPPTGEGPSESSIPKDELAKWKSHFAIMPYEDRQEEWGDGFDEYRLEGHSLADWLGECRKNCEVDRLRWFLADLETFCQGRFGGQAMTTDGEGKTVQKFVLKDPARIETAAAVYESWPGIRDGVCREFLGGLVSRIREAVGKSDVLAGFPAVIEDGQYYIKLYRKCWAKPGSSDRTTEIMLATDRSVPNGWYFAVWSPRPKEDRGNLDKELKDGIGTGASKAPLPWWEWVKEDWRNWDSLLAKLQGENALHRENQDSSGEITSYFVDRFIEIAKISVPIIDKFERASEA